MKKYRIGIIGLGGMGQNHLEALSASERWEVAAICDLSEERLAVARDTVPEAKATKASTDIYSDPSIDAVGVFTLADIRPRLITEALASGKHVSAEKPLGGSVAEEKDLLRTIEASDRIVAVNLINRNAWYNEAIHEFINSGQIGELAALVISHQTPGLMPTEGHGPEGPPFHDCGMHFIDLARWFAGSEFEKWHAQGLRLWSWEEPWWVTAHGHFKNGVVFSVTQGSYGSLARDKAVRCGLDAIGTLGVARMHHDFETAQVAFHGISHSEVRKGPYGKKKLDVMYDRFARALDTGDKGKLPSPQDSVIASEVSQAMVDACIAERPPVVGTPEEMERILAHRVKYKAEIAKAGGVHPGFGLSGYADT